MRWAAARKTRQHVKTRQVSQFESWTERYRSRLVNNPRAVVTRTQHLKCGDVRCQKACVAGTTVLAAAQLADVCIVNAATTTCPVLACSTRLKVSSLLFDAKVVSILNYTRTSNDIRVGSVARVRSTRSIAPAVAMRLPSARQTLRLVQVRFKLIIISKISFEY